MDLTFDVIYSSPLVRARQSAEIVARSLKLEKKLHFTNHLARRACHVSRRLLRGRITGGKIIAVKTRAVKSRVAMALRLCAQSLLRSKDYLGECCRRWKARLGAPKALTAMAHKLARILWHLIKYREAYDPKVWAAAEEKLKAKRLKRLEQSAATYGLKLVSLATT